MLIKVEDRLQKTIFQTKYMNSRDYKSFHQGHWYHVYNRGNNKEPIFFDDKDYRIFLQRLAVILGLIPPPRKTFIQPFSKGDFSILAYCLMPNHFHILISQERETSLAILMKKLGTSYVKYFNARYERVGNLFQDTFKSKLVENDGYLTYLSAYIHNNPINPLEYRYSSMGEYINPHNSVICDTDFLLSYFNNDREKYKQFVQNYSYQDYKKISDLTLEN